MNDDIVGNGKQQWFPSIAVDPVTGDIFVSYFSMDSTDFWTARYVAYSPNGGDSFDVFRVSDERFTPTALGWPAASGYMGDYYEIAVYNRKAYPTWSDNRTGVFQAFVSKVETSIGVTVDQKLEDGVTSVGTVGRWNGSAFDRYTPPQTFTFSLGTTEVLHADTNLYSGQKYNNWNEDPDIVNHHSFYISPEMADPLTSNFKSVNSATIRTTTVSGADIQFKDPWLIDFNDPPYGMRNQGMNAPFKIYSSPLNITVDSEHKGVFLNQDPAQGMAYYSLRAPRLSANMEGIWVFDHWEVVSGSASFNNPGNRQTAVVFLQDNTTIEAVYVNAITTQGRTVVIENEETLTIPAGANYSITNNAFEMEIHGTLNMIGTEYNRIVLDAPVGNNWAGVLIYSPTVNLEYVDIKDAQSFLWEDPFEALVRHIRMYDISEIQITGGQLTIESSSIERCSNSLYVEDGNITIRSTTITDNSTAGITAYSSNVSLYDVTISGSPQGLFFSAFRKDLIIDNCVISHGDEGIIARYGDNVTLTYSVIHHFSATGITHEIAMYQSNKNITIENSTVANSLDGVKCIIPRGANTNLAINNSIFAADNYPYILDISPIGGSIDSDVLYSDFYSSNGLPFDTESWVGSNGNISLDPAFVTPQSDDYSLSWPSYPDPVDKSPCIDAGDPAQQDPDGTRIDMGAIFFDAAPAAPTNLAVAAFNGRPRLTWDANAEPDLDHYNVWVKYSNFSNPGFWHKVATTTSTSWIDNNVQTGGRPLDTARYKVTAEDEGGNVSDYSNTVRIRGDVLMWPAKQAVEIAQIPESYALHENHPNPFNPTTTIKYDLPENSLVELRIYDLLGREIRTVINGREEVGFKSVVWDGKDNLKTTVSSGMYIYRFSARSMESEKEFHQTRKMVLLR